MLCKILSLWTFRQERASKYYQEKTDKADALAQQQAKKQAAEAEAEARINAAKMYDFQFSLHELTAAAQLSNTRLVVTCSKYDSGIVTIANIHNQQDGCCPLFYSERICGMFLSEERMYDLS